MPGFEEEDDGGSLLFILQTPMTTAELYVELEDKQAANETLVQARERDNTSKALLLLPSTSSSPINELKGGVWRLHSTGTDGYAAATRRRATYEFKKKI